MMNKFTKIIAGALLSLSVVACQEEIETPNFDSYVGIEMDKFQFFEGATVQIPVKLNTATPSNASVTVSYTIKGAGWESKINDLTEGKVVIPATKYTSYIELEGIYDKVSEDDFAFEIEITNVESDSKVEIGGANFGYDVASINMMNLGELPCSDDVDLFIGKSINIAYADRDVDAYSNPSIAGTVEASEWEDCNAITIVGDVVNYYGAGCKMNIILNELDNSVEVPLQDMLDNGTVIQGSGVYNPSSKTISVTVIYLGYGSVQDLTDPEFVLPDTYSGTITVTLK
ncbi:hypothetical protein [Algivirga pacifica]|uniref:Calx-beta domain-containing protein n=1 Tax=Algivirga pacifica TaxID=1162670 RepID=A0ABP9D9L4_9BACT